MKKSRSLATTIILYFLTLSLLALLITNFLGLYFNFRTQNIVVAQQQHLIAENAASKVEGFIQEKIRILEMVCHFSNLARMSQEEQKATLEKLIGFERSFRQLAFVNTENQETIKVSRLSNSISDNLINLAGSDLFDRLSKRETYISPVYIDTTTSEPMMILAVPAIDVFGVYTGAILSEINLKFLWDFVDNIKVSNNGLAYVVNRQGNLIAFKDISRVLRGENLSKIKDVSEYMNSNLPDATEVEIGKGILGSWVVMNYTPLQNPDWAVLVESPVLSVYGPVISELIYSIIIISICVVLIILISMYLSKIITKPVIALRDAAILIGEGKLDTQVQIESKSEIGELAAAFEQMIMELKKAKAESGKYSQNLEKQVADRTQELSLKMEELEKFNRLAVDRELRMIELKSRIKELEGNKADTEKI